MYHDKAQLQFLRILVFPNTVCHLFPGFDPFFVVINGSLETDKHLVKGISKTTSDVSFTFFYSLKNFKSLESQYHEF